MSLNIRRQLRQIQRFGALARYIDAHLDDSLSLAQLADIACISRHRLDADFHAYARETPMGRVWRLRLLRARQHISAHTDRPLLDIALDAGYGSAQAFSRAFKRLHGITPAASRQHASPGQPSLRIERLPEMPIQYIPYAGPRGEFAQASNELRARAMACAIDRQKRFGWAVNVEANLFGTDPTSRIETRTALLHMPLEQRIPGLDLGCLDGGAYAVFRFQGSSKFPAASTLIARIAQETGWQLRAGPWLRRCRNAQYLPSCLESHFELYLPAQADNPETYSLAQAFILEK
jgi:AraC-like DNA-binding protein